MTDVWLYQVYLPENGTTVYDTLPLSVNKVYIFTDNMKNPDIDDMRVLSDAVFGTIGIVIVDTYVL